MPKIIKNILVNVIDELIFLIMSPSRLCFERSSELQAGGVGVWKMLVSCTVCGVASNLFWVWPIGIKSQGTAGFFDHFFFVFHKSPNFMEE